MTSPARTVLVVSPCIVAGMFVIGGLAAVDVPVGDALRYLAYLAIIVTLPGSVVWWTFATLRDNGIPDRLTWLEIFVFGTGLGYALELLAYVAARAAGFPRAYPALLLLLCAACLWWRRQHRPRPVEFTRVPAGVMWSLAGMVGYLVVWLNSMLFASHPLRATRLTDPDEMFHLALVGELRHHFPATYPYVEYPSSLTYQWFVHAHMAASTWMTGLTPEEVYRRFDPLVLCVVALLGVAVLAVRVSSSFWSGPIAMGLLLLVGSFDVTGSVVGAAAPEERFLQASILMHSPTQTFAFVLALPTAALALDLADSRAFHPLGWLLFGTMLVAISGAKVTFLPMFVCGFIAAGAIRLLRAQGGMLRLLVATAMTAGVIVLSAIALYDGKSQSLAWDPFHATRFFMKTLGLAAEGEAGVLLISLALLVMWLVPAAGVLVLLIDRDSRWDPKVWWLLGSAASGYGATLLLGHGGVSEVYFGRSAAVLVAVASAWGVAVAFSGADRRHARTALAVALVAGVLLFLVRLATESWREPIPMAGEIVETPVLRLWINLVVVLIIGTAVYAARLIVRDLTGGRRSVSMSLVLAGVLGLGLARTIAFVVGHEQVSSNRRAEDVFGADGRAAAEWVRAHSSPDDIVMTNVHCGPALPSKDDECDARHFWMSAISERRFVVEGWAYTARSGGWTDPFWGSPSLLAANDSIFSEPDGSLLDTFARRHGVRWLLVDRRGPLNYQALTALENVAEVLPGKRYAVLRVRG